jgi:undecaprenyl-diphosphatase
LAATIVERILDLPTWVALTIVFLLPALEASAFVGFVFPGEISVLLGGVLASQGRLPLWTAIVAAVLGAVIGDSVGYLVGRRWGRKLLHSTVGRLPLVRHNLERHLDRAQAFVKRRRGSAVFFGRFTAALRVLVPGLAGMSGVHYPVFFAYNVAGGLVWGAGFVLLGYVAGENYRRVEAIAGRFGLSLLALIVLGLVLTKVSRRLRERSSGARALGDRLAALPPFAWVRRTFPGPVGWARARLGPGPRGFALTFTVAVGGLAAWIFGGLTQDVVGHDETATFDPRAEAFAMAHRTGMLTAAMKWGTWLGSTLVIVPLVVIVGAVFLARHRDWRPGAKLAVAVAGAVALYDVVKPAVGRVRPPSRLWIGEYSGFSFPSGHATQSLAFYGMLAVVLSSRRSPAGRVWPWLAAAGVAVFVGASRVYLGAHWLTDVLAGYALAAAWLAVVVVVVLAVSGWPPTATDAARDGPGRSEEVAPSTAI